MVGMDICGYRGGRVGRGWRVMMIDGGDMGRILVVELLDVGFAEIGRE